MTIAYPLRLFFDCSTAHLSVAGRAYLDAHAAARDEMIAATPYGWFVWCPEERDDEHPADLARILAHARDCGAEYVLFDADAAEDSALLTFDWSG